MKPAHYPEKAMMHLFLFLTALSVSRGQRIVFPDEERSEPAGFPPLPPPFPMQHVAEGARVPIWAPVARPQFSQRPPVNSQPPPKIPEQTDRQVDQGDRAPEWTSFERPNFSQGQKVDTRPPLKSPEQIYWTKRVNNVLAQSVLSFATDMDYAIGANRGPSGAGVDPENIIFSPLNLAGTLGVVLLGAAGRTFDEIVNILRLEVGIDVSSQSEIVHQIFGFFLNSIENSATQGGPEISMAGGVFVENGYPIRPEFFSVAKNVYQYDVYNVDFSRNPVSAQDFINYWVREKTRGIIKSLLDNVPDFSTKVILASALYFSGEWKRHFFNGATRRKPFTLSSGRVIDIDMMYSGGRFPFYADRHLGVKILGMPYKKHSGDGDTITNESLHEGTMMYLLVPTKGTLEKLKRSLTPAAIEMLINKMNTTSCVIGMPRMRLSSSLSLNPAFQTLGIHSLFAADQANLALLSSANETMSRINFGPRINVEEPPNDFSDKVGYFRYEDDVSDYDVQQWNNGFYLNKREKSRAAAEAPAEPSGKPATEATRAKRQVRPVDPNFQRFIQSQRYPSYGLDNLRNSGQLGNPGLYASDIVHKVEIDVTEIGTVATAATGVVIQRSGDFKRIVADKPFLFFIRHNPSGLILFWGSINKPTPNY